MFKMTEEKYFKNRYKKIIKDVNVIGIIGSRGKSSVGILMYQMLNKLGITTSFISEYYYSNNKEHKINNMTHIDLYNLIFDSYSLDIKNIIVELNDIDIERNTYRDIKFDTIIFTNICNDFKSTYGSMNNYLRNYKKVFRNLKLKGLSIINVDDPYGLNFLKRNTITYGFDEGDYKIDKYILKTDNTLFTYTFNNKRYFIKDNLIGRNNIYNLLVSIILINQYDIKIEAIYPLLNSLYIPFKNEIINYGNGKVLIDSALSLSEVITTINTAKLFNLDIYVVLTCNNNMHILTEYLFKNTKRSILANNGLKYGINDINEMLEGNVQDNYEIILNKQDAILRGLSYVRNKGILLILGKNDKSLYDLIKESKKIKIDNTVCNK